MLEALGELKKLREIDFNTSADTIRPFLVTVPRVYMLMQNSWPDLERLYITALRSSFEGPSREEDEMWKLSDEVAFQKTLTGYASREKADKAKEGGDGSLNGVEKVTEASKSLPAKRKGLKDLLLFEFNVQGSELALILQDVSPGSHVVVMQLRRLTDSRDVVCGYAPDPGAAASRIPLPSPESRFHAAHLRPQPHHARLDPAGRLGPCREASARAVPSAFPEPSERLQDRSAVDGVPRQDRPLHIRPRCHHSLPPAPYSPALRWPLRFCCDLCVVPAVAQDVRIPETCSIRSFELTCRRIPTSSVSYSNCPTISPSTLNKILNKNYTRVREVKNPE